MIAWARTMRPPPPRPWTARKAMSWSIVLGQAAQDAADQEDDDGDLEQALAAEEVAELAVERRRHRRRQQVGGDDPRQVVEPAEVAGDRRQGGGDDGLVERGQQHAEHQPAEDDQDLPVASGAGGAAGDWSMPFTGARRRSRRCDAGRRRAGESGGEHGEGLVEGVAPRRRGDRWRSTTSSSNGTVASAAATTAVGYRSRRGSCPRRAARARTSTCSTSTRASRWRGTSDG